MPIFLGNHPGIVRLPRRLPPPHVDARRPCQHPASNSPNTPDEEPPTAPEPIKMGLWAKPCPPAWAITEALCVCRGVSHAGAFTRERRVSTRPAISQHEPGCEPPTAPEPIEMGLWVKPCPPPWAITPALCDCRGVSYAGGFMPQCLVSTQPAISQTRPNCEPPTEVGIISPSGRFQSARGRDPFQSLPAADRLSPDLSSPHCSHCVQSWRF